MRLTIEMPVPDDVIAADGHHLVVVKDGALRESGSFVLESGGWTQGGEMPVGKLRPASTDEPVLTQGICS